MGDIVDIVSEGAVVDTTAASWHCGDGTLVDATAALWHRVQCAHCADISEDVSDDAV